MVALKRDWQISRTANGVCLILLIPTEFRPLPSMESSKLCFNFSFWQELEWIGSHQERHTEFAYYFKPPSGE